jgi:hypothetical protein
MEEFANIRWVIFDASEIGTIDFSQVCESDVNSLRKSIDETKTFVKYDTSMPSSVSSLTTKTQEYTHSEILAILATSEWSTPFDPNNPP